MNDMNVDSSSQPFLVLYLVVLYIVWSHGMLWRVFGTIGASDQAASTVHERACPSTLLLDIIPVCNRDASASATMQGHQSGGSGSSSRLQDGIGPCCLGHKVSLVATLYSCQLDSIELSLQCRDHDGWLHTLILNLRCHWQCRVALT